MEDQTEQNPPTTSWWITSLAISVTCCAILFVFFAGYLGSIKKELANENAQLEQVSLRQDKLLFEVQALQRSVGNSQPAIVTTTTPAPAATTTPAASGTTASPIVPNTTDIGTSAPTTLTQPVTAPNAPAPTGTPPAVAPTAVPDVIKH